MEPMTGTERQTLAAAALARLNDLRRTLGGISLQTKAHLDWLNKDLRALADDAVLLAELPTTPLTAPQAANSWGSTSAEVAEVVRLTLEAACPNEVTRRHATVVIDDSVSRVVVLRVRLLSDTESEVYRAVYDPHAWRAAKDHIFITEGDQVPSFDLADLMRHPLLRAADKWCGSLYVLGILRDLKEMGLVQVTGDAVITNPRYSKPD